MASVPDNRRGCIYLSCRVSGFETSCSPKAVDLLSRSVLTLSGAGSHPAGLLEVISCHNRNPGGSAKHAAQTLNLALEPTAERRGGVFF